MESQFYQNLEQELPSKYDVKKALPQVSPNFRKGSGKVLHDRSRKQTYDDPDEISAVGLSELWTLSPLRYDTTK